MVDFESNLSLNITLLAAYPSSPRQALTSPDQHYSNRLSQVIQGVSETIGFTAFCAPKKLAAKSLSPDLFILSLAIHDKLARYL
jgi:hypothetical protein